MTTTSSPDASFTIEPKIVRNRFLMSDGRVIDVTHAWPDGSGVREKVLQFATETWGKDDKRKIEGATIVTVVAEGGVPSMSTPTSTPRKRAVKKVS